MQRLCKFEVDCGLQGKIIDTFICNEAQWKFLRSHVKKKSIVYLLNALGSDSAVRVFVGTPGYFKTLSTDQDFIKQFEVQIGRRIGNVNIFKELEQPLLKTETETCSEGVRSQGEYFLREGEDDE